jgi:hypothetical protein
MTIAEVIGSIAAPGPKTLTLLIMTPTAKTAKAARIETFLLSVTLSLIVPHQLLENGEIIPWSRRGRVPAVAGPDGLAGFGQRGIKVPGRQRQARVYALSAIRRPCSGTPGALYPLRPGRHR